MLITITQAIRHYATPRATIVEAVSSGRITRHERGDKVLVDTDELDAIFVPTPPSTKDEEPEPDPVAEPPVPAEQASQRRRLPTPDELDAAVRQAMQSPGL